MKRVKSKTKSKKKIHQEQKKTSLRQTRSKISKKKRSEQNYSVDALQEALNAIGKGDSFRKAASKFGVPKSTLFRKINSESPIECKKGAHPTLCSHVENDFASWIVYRAEHGFPVTKNELLDTVNKYIVNTGTENKFKNNRPGEKWYKLFMQRHKDLSVRTAQNLTTTRAQVREEDLKSWFIKLQEYLQERNLLDIQPSRVFNLDESAFMLVPPNSNTVLAKKGAKSVYKIVSSNDKGSLTVLFTANAAGQLLPPMILFDVKTTPRKEVLEKMPRDWIVGNTDKGWMTADSFYKYIKDVFYKWLLENSYEFPVILYVDNHSSHLTMELVQFCKEKNIQLIGLYPNSTHIIQPLDVSLFHVLKEKYKITNEKWRADNDIINMKKCMLAPILKATLDSYDFTECLINGFRTCGLMPFNPEAVNYNILNKKKNNNNNKTVSDTTTSSAEILSLDCNTHLEFVEKQLISADLLAMFQINECADHWDGDVQQAGLFEMWRKLKRMSGK